MLSFSSFLDQLRLFPGHTPCRSSTRAEITVICYRATSLLKKKIKRAQNLTNKGTFHQKLRKNLKKKKKAYIIVILSFTILTFKMCREELTQQV